MDLSEFADHSRRAMEWTRKQLTQTDMEYLSRLSMQERAEDILLSHGSPENPIWGYILSQPDAINAFRNCGFTRCFFGHTHLPSYFIERRGPQEPSYELDYGKSDFSIGTADPDIRILLNPGSVGFPRDEADAPRPSRLARAAARYALFDTNTGVWQFKRLEYDMRDTVKRMKKNGLW
jgi:diadenosine tetraphosphatase ApaH/serine/threonine PP2A family protein phosphatase